MKKLSIFVVSILVSFTFFSNQANASSEAQYKVEAERNFTKLGEAAKNVFVPRYRAVANHLRWVKTTRDYRDCMKKRGKKQVYACERVGKLAGQAPKNYEQQRVEKEMQRQDRDHQNYIATLRKHSRKQTSTTAHNLVIHEYNDEMNALNRFSKNYESELKRKCWNKPLAASVRCAINDAIYLFETRLPRMVNRANDDLHEKMREGLKTIRRHIDDNETNGLLVMAKEEAELEEVSVDFRMPVIF